jgi:hypothetical protein
LPVDTPSSPSISAGSRHGWIGSLSAPIAAVNRDRISLLLIGSAGSRASSIVASPVNAAHRSRLDRPAPVLLRILPRAVRLRSLRPPEGPRAVRASPVNAAPAPSGLVLLARLQPRQRCRSSATVDRRRHQELVPGCRNWPSSALRRRLADLLAGIRPPSARR